MRLLERPLLREPHDPFTLGELAADHLKKIQAIYLELEDIQELEVRENSTDHTDSMSRDDALPPFETTGTPTNMGGS